MAAFGQTQTFKPRSANTAVRATNMSNVNRMFMSLDLDGEDFLHDQVAHQLEEDPHARHGVAGRVLDEKLHVLAVGIEHQESYRDRNTRESRSGDAAVGADRLDLAAQLESLPDQRGQFIE